MTDLGAISAACTVTIGAAKVCHCADICTGTEHYLKEKAQQEAAKQKEAERKNMEREQGTDSSGEAQSVDASSDEEQANQLQQTNENGWEGLIVE